MKKLSIVIVALIAVGAGFVVSWHLNSNKSIVLEDGLWFGDHARALPEFELVDQNNETITRDSLKGKWNLMFFGYTHCPDICPTTLQTMNQMMQAIDDPDVRMAVRVYFVSVDPGRDSPEVLASYVDYFNPDFIAATAPDDKLRMLTGALGIAHEIHKRSDDDLTYGVDHSGAIVLINPRAEFAGLFSAPHNSLAMARDLAKIIEHF
jgi:protein SCO1/2